MKHRPTIDQAGSFGAAVFALAGVFDVAARLNITGDELAIALGAVFTIVAAIRHAWEVRQDDASA